MMKPPSWPTLRLINVGVAIFCGTLAVVDTPSWSGLLSAFAAGTCLASAVHASAMIRITKHIDALALAFNAMRELAEELLREKTATRYPDNDDIPTAPRLH